MFRDRADAGCQLGEKLASYRGELSLALALPRGGVVVGYRKQEGRESGKAERIQRLTETKKRNLVKTH